MFRITSSTVLDSFQVLFKLIRGVCGCLRRHFGPNARTRDVFKIYISGDAEKSNTTGNIYCRLCLPRIDSFTRKFGMGLLFHLYRNKLYMQDMPMVIPGLFDSPRWSPQWETCRYRATTEDVYKDSG